jgi:hypothetical protein
MKFAAPPKKERERRFVQSFLRISGLPAKILEEREAPDFLLEFEGRRIGLEVTEVFVEDDGSPIKPKAVESIVDDIVARAKQRYEECGGKPLHVSFGFSRNADMRQLNRREAAEAIASFLLALDPPVDELVKWDRRWPRRDQLPQELSFMNILAVPGATKSHWSTPRAGWVAPLTANFLQPSIDEKSKKIARYQGTVRDVWLLLAIEGRAPSQFFEPSQEIPTVASSFNRTYLLWLFAGKVYLLPSTNVA